MANTPDQWRSGDRSLSSFNGWRPLLRQLDEMFNLPVTSGEQRSFVPALDVDEQKERYLVRVDMPGLKKEDIDIEVTGNQLHVSGERRQDVDRHEGRTHLVERRYGRFERVLALPDGINSQRVEAQYENGVLTIVIPKSEGAGIRKVKIGEGQSKHATNRSQQIDAKSPNAGSTKQDAAPH